MTFDLPFKVSENTKQWKKNQQAMTDSDHTFLSLYKEAVKEVGPENLTQDAISERLGVNPGTLHNRYKQAIIRLAWKVQHQDFPVEAASKILDCCPYWGSSGRRTKEATDEQLMSLLD